MPAMSAIENRIATGIHGGEAVHYEVSAVYTKPSGIPDYVHLVASGNRGTDVDCYVHNVPRDEPPVCSSQTYGGN
ncbi:hypothetical protein SAMN05216223_103534 [Actinacidiphila yanglinensis]|uniref:Uncharacterized protein n=2 Tax=Actinacidiphila yanglinensis TaxID=310779 RepID=A0A1H5Y412_9ACTN|nr:hypothetical protein SAMN05216223_103534 [Actinacidiphila yanglinensis]